MVAAVVEVALEVASVEALVVAAVEAFALLVVPDPPPLNVDPMSPQRMLEKTTWVVGLFLMIRSGLPSVASQGPLLPESSQFMYPVASFQMANVSTTAQS